MFRPLFDRPSAGLPPIGVALRPIDPEGDLRSLHALDARAFAADPGYTPESVVHFGELSLFAHDSAPALGCVALVGGTPVGFICSCRWEEESVGYVDVLAVDPSNQRRGIATAMLRYVFAAYASTGLAEAQLSVASDNPRALALYESVGMTERFRYEIYERPLDAVAGTPAGGR